MKKISIIALIFGLLFVTGCGCSKEKENIVVNECNNKSTNDNFEYEVNYSFESVDGVLKKYIRTEKYLSEKKDVLNEMKDYKENFFAELVSIDGVRYDGNIAENVFETELEIDFSKVDTKILFETEPFYLNFYDDELGIVTIDYVLEYYEGENISCS